MRRYSRCVEAARPRKSPAILILANFYEGLSCGVRKARVLRSSFHDEKRKKTVRERK
jgi:hypothetical protein